MKLAAMMLWVRLKKKYTICLRLHDTHQSLILLIISHWTRFWCVVALIKREQWKSKAAKDTLVNENPSEFGQRLINVQYRRNTSWVTHKASYLTIFYVPAYRSNMVAVKFNKVGRFFSKLFSMINGLITIATLLPLQTHTGEIQVHD